MNPASMHPKESTPEESRESLTPTLRSIVENERDSVKRKIVTIFHYLKGIYATTGAIAKDTGIDERTVRRYVTKLHKIGLIEIFKHNGARPLYGERGMLKKTQKIFSDYHLPAAERLSECVDVFSIVSHPIRIHIINLLLQQNARFGMIVNACRQSNPTVAPHLYALQEAGYVEHSTEGVYSASKELQKRAAELWIFLRLGQAKQRTGAWNGHTRDNVRPDKRLERAKQRRETVLNILNSGQADMWEIMSRLSGIYKNRRKLYNDLLLLIEEGKIRRVPNQGKRMVVELATPATDHSKKVLYTTERNEAVAPVIVEPTPEVQPPLPHPEEQKVLFFVEENEEIVPSVVAPAEEQRKSARPVPPKKIVQPVVEHPRDLSLFDKDVNPEGALQQLHECTPPSYREAIFGILTKLQLNLHHASALQALCEEFCSDHRAVTPALLIGWAKQPPSEWKWLKNGDEQGRIPRKIIPWKNHWNGVRGN